MRNYSANCVNGNWALASAEFFKGGGIKFLSGVL